MRDFRQLKVSQKAHTLVLAVYRATATFPQEERYGLTTQMRRSCTSIPSNIAEGCGKDGNAELGRFLGIALGSASELDYQILLACDLGLLEATEFERLQGEVTEVKRMLGGFIHTLRSQSVAMSAAQGVHRERAPFFDSEPPLTADS